MTPCAWQRGGRRATFACTMTSKATSEAAPLLPPQKAQEPEWPEHFPPGCPDACEAEDVGGPVYRLVRPAGDPQKHLDTRSWLEENRPAPKATDCERASLSCCRTLDDIEELRSSWGHFKNRKIAVAQLKPEHGKIAKTLGPGHHSLWLRRKSLLAHDTLFKVIA